MTAAIIWWVLSAYGHEPGKQGDFKYITDDDIYKAGFGAGHTQTVFSAKRSTKMLNRCDGGQYVGDALGTFDGSFYDNTTSYTMSGTLLTNMANYRCR